MLSPRYSVTLWFLAALTAGSASAKQPKIDFARDIEPIFAKHCYRCHGPDVQEGNLRLDDRAAALKGGDNGSLFVAGKSRESLIIERVTAEDDSVRMPQESKPLEAESIGRLKRWIDEGATWPERAAEDPRRKHWSFQRPKRPPLPEVRAWELARNAIDRFVLARLDAQGLAPSPEAERDTLARRLFLDLIGLPPTLEELDAFLADDSPDAYERQADRLLASPHYGEHWGRRWLDLARYADTNGYEKDRPRSMWPYRDWVIAALNADMPFDQFTIEQIAGDMLPGATLQQRVATGFHRNTMINEEGGVDNAEFRFASVVDRVATTGAVWLGLTLNCCQCHSHKYDPISQKEYYQFFAMLNNADEPEIEVPDPDVARRRAEIESQIAAISRKMRDRLPSLRDQYDAWLRHGSARAKHWTVLTPTKMVSLQGATLTVLEDGSVLAGGDIPNNDTYVVELPLPEALEQITALRLEVLPHESLPAGGPGRAVFDSGAGPKGDFLLSEIEVAVVEPGGGEMRPIKLQNATQSYTQEKRSAALATDGILDTGWSVKGRIGEPHWAVFECGPLQSGPLAPRAERAGNPSPPPADRVGQTGKTLLVKLVQQYIHQMTIGRFRISVTADDPPIAAHPAPAEIEAILLLPPDQRTAAQTRQLEEHFLSVAEGTADLRQEIAGLKANMPQHPTTLVMQERLPQHARVTHLHQRGEFLRPREPVKAGMPAVLHALSPDAPASRLALARWLVDPANPLVGRVVMNRAWQDFFGRGIVRTSEDFGTQGARPTHGELLDWLAIEFVEGTPKCQVQGRMSGERVQDSGFRVQPDPQSASGAAAAYDRPHSGEAAGRAQSNGTLDFERGTLDSPAWEFKRMHRQIVTSYTYRQSSRVTPDLAARDPNNELLARGPRHRVEAEVVRDIALTAAGQLTRQIGGPSVFPPQPEGVLALSYGGFNWKTATGGQRYRRGLYTFAKRTVPYATFTTFDAPSRETCVVRRERSNTPLQSLTLLNDTVFVEAARALAECTLLDGPKQTVARIEWIFRRCVAREPTEDERAAVAAFLDEQTRRLKAGELNATVICGVEPDKPPAGLDLTEWGAWTTVARAILNLDETISKE
jgi:hypothetical protein